MIFKICTKDFSDIVKTHTFKSFERAAEHAAFIVSDLVAGYPEAVLHGGRVFLLLHSPGVALEFLRRTRPFTNLNINYGRVLEAVQQVLQFQDPRKLVGLLSDLLAGIPNLDLFQAMECGAEFPKLLCLFPNGSGLTTLTRIK